MSRSRFGIRDPAPGFERLGAMSLSSLAYLLCLFLP